MNGWWSCVLLILEVSWEKFADAEDLSPEIRRCWKMELLNYARSWNNDCKKKSYHTRQTVYSTAIVEMESRHPHPISTWKVRFFFVWKRQGCRQRCQVVLAASSLCIPGTWQIGGSTLSWHPMVLSHLRCQSKSARRNSRPAGEPGFRVHGHRLAERRGRWSLHRGFVRLAGVGLDFSFSWWVLGGWVDEFEWKIVKYCDHPMQIGINYIH